MFKLYNKIKGNLLGRIIDCTPAPNNNNPHQRNALDHWFKNGLVYFPDGCPAVKKFHRRGIVRKEGRTAFETRALGAEIHQAFFICPQCEKLQEYVTHSKFLQKENNISCIYCHKEIIVIVLESERWKNLLKN